jgi:hypothetical protein
MGTAILGDVLSDWSSYELDDSVYLPVGASASLNMRVNVVPFDPEQPDLPRIFDDQEYLLGIEQIRDVVDGLQQQLGRAPTPDERLRAVLHYARYDAFIDPDAL